MPVTTEKLIARYVAEAFDRYSRRKYLPEIKVTFYPFTQLRNTIWLRGSIARVRISDVLADAPPEVHRALAFILVADLYQRRAARTMIHIFDEYVERDEILKHVARIRRERERITTRTSRGRVYNLKTIYADLNQRYFDGQLRRMTLKWSRGERRDLLGWHDEQLREIVISRLLDSELVPQFALEYVLYHEMLHVIHPMRLVNGRCQAHSPAFRRDERQFDQYEEALRVLAKLWQSRFPALP